MPSAGPGQERLTYPHFLPDGRHFLFSHGSVIAVGTLDSPDVKDDVARIESKPEYANGHLLFVRDGDLFAQPFDVVVPDLSPRAVSVVLNWTALLKK